jgi:hypothetical protein
MLCPNIAELRLEHAQHCTGVTAPSLRDVALLCNLT